MNPRLEWILSEYEVEVLLAFLHSLSHGISKCTCIQCVWGWLSWHWLFSCDIRARKKRRRRQKKLRWLWVEIVRKVECVRDVNKTSRLKSIHLRERDSFRSSDGDDDSMRFNGMSRQNPITVTMRNSRDFSKYTCWSAPLHEQIIWILQLSVGFVPILVWHWICNEGAWMFCQFFGTFFHFSRTLCENVVVFYLPISLNYAILSTLESHCLLACAAHLLCGGRRSYRINPLQVEVKQKQEKVYSTRITTPKLARKKWKMENAKEQTVNGIYNCAKRTCWKVNNAINANKMR